MPTCPGTKTKDGRKCNAILYRCKKCGAVGCAQPQANACSNEAFQRVSKCTTCGTIGQKEIFR